MLIEIIGLPGSGKSTLLKKILKDKSLSKDFTTWDKVKVIAIKSFLNSNSIPMSKFNLRIANYLLSVPLINRLISEFLLQKKVKYSFSMFNDFWGDISELIIKGILDRKILTSSMKPHYINWELEKIVRSKLLKNYSKEKKLKIILDEGVVTAISTLGEIDDLNSVMLDTILPDAVIFVSTELTDVVKVAETRKNEGRQVQLSTKSKEEIHDFYKQKLTNYHSLIKILKTKGIPVIELNRNQKLSEQIDEINILNK